MSGKLQASLYWYDYETFGVDPRRDRPAQFAGIRTDEDLNIISEPLNIFCRLSDDYLPHPEACLITGITPQRVNSDGLCEAEFIGRIHRELAHPHTCIAGYNNIRFDDEVTRFTLYRNLFDPYGHEWQNGNSRWDVIDLARVTHALRPDGIVWPKNDDGTTTFRLERLTGSNGIAHAAAHDALADVMATLALAKLIRDRQPRLVDYVYTHRKKAQVAELLSLANPSPVLHVSSRYPAELGCIALVVPVAQHPVNKNEILVYDLRVDPEEFLTLSADDIASRLFTPAQDLPAGVQRVPVKSVHINKAPVIVPANTLTPEQAEKWRIDPGRAAQYQQRLRDAQTFSANLRAIFQEKILQAGDDPDFMLYEGGFFSNQDRARLETLRTMSAVALQDYRPRFDDARLPEMLFRYRARNFPQTLLADEHTQWREFRQQRLLQDSARAGLRLDDYRTMLRHLRDQPELGAHQQQILQALESYGEMISSTLT